MSKHLRILFLSAAVAVPLGSATAAEVSPREIVTELYRLELGPKGDMSEGPLHDFRDSLIQRRLTVDFQNLVSRMKAYERKTGDAILDWDPIADGNGAAPLDIHVDAKELESNKAEVEVNFHITGGERHKLVYRFVRERGVWKIDDIVARNISLRKTIQRGVSAK